MHYELGDPYKGVFSVDAYNGVYDDRLQRFAVHLYANAFTRLDAILVGVFTCLIVFHFGSKINSFFKNKITVFVTFFFSFIFMFGLSLVPNHHPDHLDYSSVTKESMSVVLGL